MKLFRKYVSYEIGLRTNLLAVGVASALPLEGLVAAHHEVEAVGAVVVAQGGAQHVGVVVRGAPAGRTFRQARSHIFYDRR